MNVMVNELLKDESDNKVFRVLWVDERNVMAYLIDIYDAKAVPFIRPVRDLIDEIVQDELIKIKDDPFLSNISQKQNEKNIVLRDKAWNVIKSMVGDEPDIYDKKRRAKHIKTVAETHGTSLPALRKYLRRYWRQTDSTNNDWKVNLSYSSEGEGTITNFWLHKGSNRVSEYYSVKQGSGAHYFPAYSTANESNVKLGAENNNYSSNTYSVSGYWDEETW